MDPAAQKIALPSLPPQEALLNTISHNMRTPLACIIGALGILQEADSSLDPATLRDLAGLAREHAERLNRLVTNLLDVSRIEGGALQVRAEPCDMQDAIGAALNQLGAAASSRPIGVSLPSRLPLVRMDFVLIVQVLVNLLENALKYSPSGAPITVTARPLQDALQVSVSDAGDGISREDLARVFEKFNRGRAADARGTGLGLSICKGLIEAHHGRIWAEQREPRGTIVTFSLPLEN